jgi:hypothetical protein
MWTREPSIAIWKRPEPLRYRIGLLCLALLVSSCVVTDEIEFQDKINMPPQLVWTEPVTDVLHMVDDDTRQTFTVQVWDPDEKDANSYEGMITIIEESNAVQPRKTSDRSCIVNVDTPPDPSEYDGGILVTFDCSVDFSLNATPVETTLIVEVDVSDRGFLGFPDEVARGANHIRVTWVFESRPATAE